MADFFSRLSERALGNATGVRPDLAPVIASTAERNPSLQNIDNEVSAKLRPQLRQTNLQTQQHDRPTFVTQAPVSTNDDGRDQRREPDVNPVHESQAPVSTNDDGRDQGREPDVNLVHKRSQPPIRKVLPEELPAITSAPTPHREEPLVTASSKSDHVPFSLEKMPQPNAAAARHEIVPAAAVKLASPPQTISSQPSPRPTIHVTIGRLEVRAVTAPANVPAKNMERRRNSLLSLDEYLRQRNEGRR